MTAYARKLKFVNFYKYFPLTYNAEINTEPSRKVGKSTSH